MPVVAVVVVGTVMRSESPSGDPLDGIGVLLGEMVVVVTSAP